jgi:hypothetical protein
VLSGSDRTTPIDTEAGCSAGLFVGAVFAAKPFITRSKNKSDGTGNSAEPYPPHFVVGAGNANSNANR